MILLLQFKPKKLISNLHNIKPSAEFSTYKYEPYEKYINKYNAIGGYNWRIPGEEISWQVEVPKKECI